MSLAEDLTDPGKDRVYDAVGMVPTRPSSTYAWFIHSFSVESMRNKPGQRPREFLAERPAAVFIPNYRTDWLSHEDFAFFSRRYVPVSDDFWVLGAVLAPGGGAFEIFHPGRYRISSLQGSDLLGTYPPAPSGAPVPEDDGRIAGVLDGAVLPGQVVALAAGKHRLETAADGRVAVVWVGPKVDRIHRQGRGDHRRLFYNWY
jgi:hypothetical protein